mmetsp:Transcript_3209/g.8546  ORF Transcript_3209/g.8546 Transcript_3209/m.8546 type:complete len:258 (-) Transcript_3209:284-1057(-)
MYSFRGPTTTLMTWCKICADRPQILSPPLLWVPPGPDVPSPVPSSSLSHPALNTGMGPTPGTRLTSTLSLLNKSSSRTAISVLPFSSALVDVIVSTSSSPRYPTTGVTAHCFGTSAASEPTPKICSLHPSPSPSSTTASLTAAPMSSESSLCLGPPGNPAWGAPKSSGLTVNSAWGILVRESWQRGTSTARACGTSGPSMRLRGIALRSWAMRLRSAGFNNPPVYPAAALPASTANGSVAIVAPNVLHGRTAAAGAE